MSTGSSKCDLSFLECYAVFFKIYFVWINWTWRKFSVNVVYVCWRKCIGHRSVGLERTLFVWFPSVKIKFCQALLWIWERTFIHCCMLCLEEIQRSESLKEEEQRILEELMEVVEQRDALVALLEEDRIRSVGSFNQSTSLYQSPVIMWSIHQGYW